MNTSKKPTSFHKILDEKKVHNKDDPYNSNRMDLNINDTNQIRMNTSKKQTSFYKFLDEKKVYNKDDPYNYQSLPPYTGKYLINDDDYDKLNNHLSKEYKNGKFNSLCQKPGEISMLRVDLDFKQSTSGRLCDIDLKKTIVDISLKQLKKILVISDKDLIVYILEKNIRNLKFERGEYKDGIHISFPYIHLNKKFQKIFILLLRSELEEIFRNIGYCNSIKQIIDNASVNNCWLCYSCKKENDKVPYLLTHIYGMEKNEIVEKELINDDKVIRKKCSIHENSKYIRNFKEGLEEQYTEKLEIYENGIINENKNNELNISSYERNMRRKVFKKKQISQSKNVSDNEIEMAKDFVGILSNDRCDDYNNWFKLGLCLFNISAMLLETWKNFSKKSSKYKEGECEEYWSKFENKKPITEKLRIGSLIHWAKIDNYDGFLKIKMKYADKYFQRSLDKKDNTIAEAIYYFYKEEHVLATFKNEDWYAFKNHKWCKDEKGNSLRKKLSQEYHSLMMDKSSECRIKLNDDIDSCEKKIYEERGNNYKEISLKMKDHSQKKKIIAEAQEYFFDDSFNELLNKKQHLIGFNNGVYNLETGNFREGRPSDFISYSTNIDYIPFSDKQIDPEFSKKIDEVYNILEKIQPCPEKNTYLLNVLASIIDGVKRRHKFYIWTGVGANGKSVLINLFKGCLGEYADVLTTSLITSKRSGSASASPELLKIKGIRLGVLQEPEENSEINVGLMKELSGGDEITARGLYANPEVFKPQFSMIMTCNHLPKVNTNDGGTWRRIEVLSFDTVFTTSPDEDNQNHVMADTEIESKISSEDIREAFMSILINQYNMLKEKNFNIEVPSAVLDQTKQYRESSDEIQDFLNENIDKTNNKKDKVKFSEINICYRNWCKSNLIKDALSKGSLKRQLENKLGRLEGSSSQHHWKYYKFIDKVEEDDDDFEISDTEEPDYA
jgi:P4 family phage/plasmid primase-like protien